MRGILFDYCDIGYLLKIATAFGGVPLGREKLVIENYEVNSCCGYLLRWEVMFCWR